MTTFTCGSSKNVRGNCGHQHQTMRTAAACMRRDNRACRKQGGYSDRGIRVLEDGAERLLTEGEYAELQNLYDGR